MTIRSGLAGQLGFGDESPWGVPAAPTLWVPIINEKIVADHEAIESEAIYVGARLSRSGQFLEGNFKAGGDINIEVYDRAMALLGKHMFGNLVTASLGGGLYSHTLTPGELTGKGLTTYTGRPTVGDGTVESMVYPGGKFASWTLACKAKEKATLALNLAARHEITYRPVTDGATTNGSAAISSPAAANWSTSDEKKPISGPGIPAGTTIDTVQDATHATMSANATATATGVTFTMGIALPSVSYPAGMYPMSFAGAGVTIAGTSYPAMEMTLSGDNGLNVDRYFLGDRGRAEPLESKLREYTGTINGEFLSIDAYRRFLRNEEFALVCSLRRGTSTLTITMNARFLGNTATVDGPDVLKQELPFKCYGTTTDAAGITAVLVDNVATP